MSQPLDRFSPMSREDFLFCGKNVFERREIADELRAEEARRAAECADDLAHAEERRAAEDSQ